MLEDFILGRAFQPVLSSMNSMSVNPFSPGITSQFTPEFVVLLRYVPELLLIKPVLLLYIYILTGFWLPKFNCCVQFIPPFVVRKTPPVRDSLTTIHIVSVFKIVMSSIGTCAGSLTVNQLVPPSVVS